MGHSAKVFTAMALAPAIAAAQAATHSNAAASSRCASLKALTQSANRHFADITGNTIESNAQRSVHRLIRPAAPPLEGNCTIWKPRVSAERHTLMCVSSHYGNVGAPHVEKLEKQNFFARGSDTYAAFISSCLGITPTMETGAHPKHPDAQRRMWKWQPKTREGWYLALDMEYAYLGKPADQTTRQTIHTFLYSPGR